MADVCSCKEIDLKEIEPIIGQYQGTQGALIPVLQAAQNIYGYLPNQALEKIAKDLKVSISQVFGVVTFYSQFRLTPLGKNVVKVCQGTACHVRGARDIIKAIEDDLHVKCGQTTADMEFTLESVACVGACSLGPIMVINEETHGRLEVKELEGILAPYKIEPEEKTEH